MAVGSTPSHPGLHATHPSAWAAFRRTLGTGSSSANASTEIAWTSGTWSRTWMHYQRTRGLAAEMPPTHRDEGVITEMRGSQLRRAVTPPVSPRNASISSPLTPNRRTSSSSRVAFEIVGGRVTRPPISAIGSRRTTPYRDSVRAGLVDRDRPHPIAASALAESTGVLSLCERGSDIFAAWPACGRCLLPTPTP